jgi:hypothetical protein
MINKLLNIDMNELRTSVQANHTYVKKRRNFKNQVCAFMNRGKDKSVTISIDTSNDYKKRNKNKQKV